MGYLRQYKIYIDTGQISLLWVASLSLHLCSIWMLHVYIFPFVWEKYGANYPVGRTRHVNVCGSGWGWKEVILNIFHVPHIVMKRHISTYDEFLSNYNYYPPLVQNSRCWICKFMLTCKCNDLPMKMHIYLLMMEYMLVSMSHISLHTYLILNFVEHALG